MLKIGIHGSNGKMGTAIIKIAKNYDIEIGYKYSRNSIFNNIDDLFISSDVIVDFSNQQCLSLILLKAIEFKKKLLIGTTGIDEQQFLQIDEAAKQIPIFYSPNTSIGVYALSKALESACQILYQQEYDITIIDFHHRQKQDAPSGTSLMLANKIKVAQAKLNNFNQNNSNPQLNNKIEFCSIRAGNEPAQLQVIFSGENDSLSLTHKANSRNIFADSAIKIAQWIGSKPKGLYTMDDYFLSHQ